MGVSVGDSTLGVVFAAAQRSRPVVPRRGGPWTSGLVSHTSLSDIPVTHPLIYPLAEGVQPAAPPFYQAALMQMVQQAATQAARAAIQQVMQEAARVAAQEAARVAAQEGLQQPPLPPPPPLPVYRVYDERFYRLTTQMRNMDMQHFGGAGITEEDLIRKFLGGMRVEIRNRCRVEIRNRCRVVTYHRLGHLVEKAAEQKAGLVEEQKLAKSSQTKSGKTDES
ncbi:hypothetical protein F2Q69_00049805 [Brassica cretica]|uniref:Uncharacterized protein n=1 Tax=Brassica cretica TaxID=69181 RepID=A0A8S9PUW7_BRACR|nr:hypothetical protein F2Q69_00049805 [Brassica cretica]